jgi:hypothetical protein
MLRIRLQQPFEHGDPLFRTAGAEVDFCQRHIGGLVLRCPLQKSSKKTDSRVRLPFCNEQERKIVDGLSVIRATGERITEIAVRSGDILEPLDVRCPRRCGTEKTAGTDSQTEELSNRGLTEEKPHSPRERSVTAERARAGVSQRELAAMFHVSQPLCSQIVRGHIWNPDSKLTTGDETHGRLVGALDTGCRRGEMMKLQNKHVDWRHRWIRILKVHAKTEVARVIPFESASRLEKLLRRRSFLGPDAYVFGNATTGHDVKTFRSAWETLPGRRRRRKPSKSGAPGRN